MKMTLYRFLVLTKISKIPLSYSRKKNIKTSYSYSSSKLRIHAKCVSRSKSGYYLYSKSWEQEWKLDFIDFWCLQR